MKPITPPIPLTERKDHAHRLAERPGCLARNVLVLRGGMGTGQRREIMQRLEGIPRRKRVPIATGRYFGEGFDDAHLGYTVERPGAASPETAGDGLLSCPRPAEVG